MLYRWVKRLAFRAGKQWSALSYMRMTLFTREMSRRFATVNMSCRVKACWEHLQRGESRQNSYDKRPVFNILFTAFQNGKCFTIQCVRWYDFACTVFAKAEYSLLEMANVVHQHTFTIFTCVFVFVNLLTCHLFHRKTLCYGLLSSLNLSHAVIGIPLYL